MKVFTVRNVNQALSAALPWMHQFAEKEESRNGTVWVAPDPVMTVYTQPRERVLFSPLRDANPFFHVMESLWMLHGDNDVTFPAYFNSGMAKYSDDSVTLWGAYGHRWREFFGYDQLDRIVDELKADPTSRRAVLTMWNAWGPEESGMELSDDLCVASHGGLDVPCNTHIYFDLRHGRLNMTVCNRSNDAIWGAYGANAVHLSFLQEYMATALDREMGVYRQFSNNFHIYEDKLPKNKWRELCQNTEENDLYAKMPECRRTTGLIQGDAEMEHWPRALELFMFQSRRMISYPEVKVEAIHFGNEFLQTVAWPMFMAFHERKQKISNGMVHINKIATSDWRIVCGGWIARRIEKGVAQ